MDDERFGDKDPWDAFDAGDAELKRQGRWFPNRVWDVDDNGILRDES